MTRGLLNAGKATLAFGTILLAWQFGAPWARVPAYVLPVPTSIVQKFWQTRGVQLEHLGQTASTTLLGLAAALLVGVALALLVVYARSLRAVVLPVLAAFNSIPKIAIAPLIVIWFGLDTEPKIVLAFLLALFPIFVNSVTGLGEIEPDMLDLSRLLGGNTWRIFVKVRLWHAAPHIADALKVAFPMALVGSVVGEFIGGNTGAGYLVLSGQMTLDTPLVFAALLSITALAVAGIGAVGLFERIFLSWRPSMRSR
jgi:NitT/TauT family transport system permease protein